MNILCIDDKPEYKYAIVSRILDFNKVNYNFVKSYNSAIKYINENFESIDGIFLDLCFPEDDEGREIDIYMGLKVLEFMKKRKIDIPILLYSSTEIDEINLEGTSCFGKMEIVEIEKIQNFLNFIRYHN